MDEIKTIQDLLTKWQEAHKENRGFIIITSERTEKGNDSDSYVETCGIIGSSGIPGVAGIIKKAKDHLMLRDLARKLNS